MTELTTASKIVNLDDYRQKRGTTCAKCGGGGDVLENGTWGFCDACDYGRRKIHNEKDFVKQVKENVEAAKQRRLSKQFGEVEIPKLFRGLAPDTLKSLGPEVLRGKHKAIEATEHWAAGNGAKPGLLLYGNPGTGKSALGWWAAPKRGEGYGLWLTWPGLYKSVQATYSGNGDTEALMRAAMETCVLFLDDLGDPDRRGLESDDRRDILFRIVNARLNEQLPTFITTNLNAQTFKVQFGERITSRVYELCELVEMSGVDLRGAS